MTLPKVLALVANEETRPGHPPTASGSVLWRLFQPLAEVQRQGLAVAEWEWKDARALDTIGPAFDVFVTPRLSWTREEYRGALRWFGLLRRLGKRTIYEVDDDLFSPWIVRQQKGGGVGSEKPVEQLEQERLDRIAALRLCDGVTVSTQRLATVVAQYTDAPVAVVPNAIDLRWFQAVQRHGTRVDGGPPRAPRGEVTIGWAGGTRPDGDLEQMAIAWGQVAQRHGHVTFVVVGHQPKVVYEHVPAHRIRAVAWLPIDAYPLGLRGIDIACCPLEDRPFNRCKTAIKSWEAAASGSAVVASPLIYGSTITHGEDGLLCQTADEWEEALCLLVEDAHRRKQFARRLLRRVEREHTLEREAWRWPVAWAQLAERARLAPPKLELVTA